MSRRALLPLFLCIFACCSILSRSVHAQKIPIALRTYPLPCQPTALAASADGATAWFACEQNATGALKSDWVYPNSVYALDLLSGKARKISEGHGVVRFLPAPRGSQAILFRLGERRARRALLLEGLRVVKPLPIDSAIEWSADGTMVYFEAGSTVQAEAWDILGVLTLKDSSIKKSKLTLPADGLFVCQATGEIYTGGPWFDGTGKMYFDTVEYDSKGKFVRKAPTLPLGWLSPNCRYMATPDSYDGPLPWEIVEFQSGKRLARFVESDDSSSPWVSFVAWNPRRESVYLRTIDTPVKGSDTATRTVLQAVDAAADNKVLAEFADFSGAAAWSADGSSVLLAKGNQLLTIPIDPAR